MYSNTVQSAVMPRTSVYNDNQWVSVSGPMSTSWSLNCESNTLHSSSFTTDQTA